MTAQRPARQLRLGKCTLHECPAYPHKAGLSRRRSVESIWGVRFPVWRLRGPQMVAVQSTNTLFATALRLDDVLHP
jgi:hypothetical protein